MSKINWHNVAIHASYAKFSQLPLVGNVREVAFSGRSNVGKSSLINKLHNRNALARVSSRPGKTITINYFNLDDKVFIVDLPGYGYAKISKEEKARFGELAESYLQSGRIALLVQLIDFRHPPTKDDLQMLDFLRQTDTNFVIALTKADKLKKSQRAANLAALKAQFPDVTLIEFSSETGEGVQELRQVIEQYG
ncbi:MAG: ribosome biogenesis GTP-binding protein YihA/YsxC [Oscillospiraceae bacterium]|nr:ribosome biogenesis GTP-binding protein YihA/YsxC [Oscillospiraceae bacterium]